MDFFINFNPPSPTTKIVESETIFSMGSCFARNWGEQLVKHGWPALYDPLDIAYNPVSLCDHIGYIFGTERMEQEDWFLHNSLWHHFDLHGSLSDSGKEMAFQKVTENLSIASGFLKKASHVIITLGTAAVFIHKKSGKVVNNCHKLPADQFDMRHLSVDECISALESIRKELDQHTNIKQVIWTVSPVRHIRRGLIENNRSKSRLILAVESMIQKHEQDYYFPSYEMLMDVWRDYRFFKKNKVHPTEEILEVIYKDFISTVFTIHAQEVWNDLHSYRRMREHRILHEGTPEAAAWLKSVVAKKERLQSAHPWLQLE